MTVLVTSCQQTNQNANMEKDLKEFIKSFEDKYVPLYKEANLAYWNAAISGKKEDFDKYNELQNKITEIFSNKVAKPKFGLMSNLSKTEAYFVKTSLK